ncbi:hypothetical protein HY488_02930 [Candidatus Woesearchaeota archaeon]|nr:hypothetical protein [Candidatus Woesearchaeota archaeon]
MQFLDDLPTKLRMVRAYLNQSWIPPGFKGNQYSRNGKPDIAHEVSHFYLSRYAWARDILSDIPDSVLKPDEIDRLFSTVSKSSKVLMNGQHVDLGSADVEVPRLVDVYKRLMGDVKENLISVLARWNFTVFEKTLQVIREKGPKALQYFVLYKAACDPAFGDKNDRTVELLRRWIYSQHQIALEQIAVNEEWGDTLGRMHFSDDNNTAWRYVHGRLWNLDEACVREALAIRYGEDEKAAVDSEYGVFTEKDHHSVVEHKLEHMKPLLELHRRYGFRDEFDFNGYSFTLEASPFIEKPVGAPVGNFDAVIFPKGGLESFLQEVAMPDFEHADGGFASVRFTISDGHLIFEELQSDIPSMLRLQKRETPVELADMINVWPEIAREAAFRIARHGGFTEMFGATPYRIIQRYGAGIHPDKTRAYFSSMERFGGKLVYDEDCVLDKQPQHYFRLGL